MNKMCCSLDEECAAGKEGYYHPSRIVSLQFFWEKRGGRNREGLKERKKKQPQQTINCCQANWATPLSRLAVISNCVWWTAKAQVGHLPYEPKSLRATEENLAYSPLNLNGVFDQGILRLYGILLWLSNTIISLLFLKEELSYFLRVSHPRSYETLLHMIIIFYSNSV